MLLPRPGQLWLAAVFGVLALDSGACSSGRPAAVEPALVQLEEPHAPPLSSALPPLEPVSAPTDPVKDLLKAERIPGPTQGEWTLPSREGLSFDRVQQSPKGGFVALGTEGQSSDRRFLLRLGEDGVPVWTARLNRGASLAESELAIDEDGTIALLAQHSEGLSFGGHELIPSEPHNIDTSVVSLLLVSDTGELKKCLSRKVKFSSPTRPIVVSGGFVMSSLDLFEPFHSEPPTSEGLIVIDSNGRELQKEVTGSEFVPMYFSSGPDLTVVGKQYGAFKLHGKTAVPAPPRDRNAWIVASFGPALALRWAHPFTDARFREATAVAQDERGHVFAAFRYGESHGFADDPFAGVMYELDERGREVRHFGYGPSVTIARLFPAPDGLTLIGYSWQTEVQLKGHPLAWPLGESSHDEFPALFLRVDAQGKPLAQREYREPEANVWTPAHQTVLADVVPAGPGFLAVVGRVTRGGPFAGLKVAKGEPELPYIARIRRP